MSGGAFDYVGDQIDDGLHKIAEGTAKKWPLTSVALCNLGSVIAVVEHDMDYDLSSDAAVADGYDQQALGKLLESILTAVPDSWFPFGKAATINHFQTCSGSEAITAATSARHGGFCYA